MRRGSASNAITLQAHRKLVEEYANSQYDDNQTDIYNNLEINQKNNNNKKKKKNNSIFNDHIYHSEDMVEERRKWNEDNARSNVRSKCLTTYGGLGYQQSQLGETLFQCIKYDAVENVARIISVRNIIYRHIPMYERERERER